MKKRTLVLVLAVLVLAFLVFWVVGNHKASAPSGGSTSSSIKAI